MKFIQNGQFALYADKVLSDKDYYKEYKSGGIDSAQFCASMLADKSLSDAAGFNERNIERIAVTPPDDKLPSETILGHLVSNKAVPVLENMYGGFDEYREYIRGNYDHGEFVTYIFPEDERLLYAATEIRKPERVFAAGSYYGYFAVWAMKTVAANGGMCVLSDINGEVCRLAEKNFNRLGFGGNVKICCEDAEKLLLNRREPIDMLILDATGKGDDPRPEYRGKRIYGALLKDAAHLLTKGSMIIIHNMEPRNPDMKTLVDELKAINAIGASYQTYNGLGVYVIV
ncbi:MAG: class I SAM-dependent methyltransferase [Oscillospiraceae bacterium]|nr:class I SAM-dependent methyltransferase [Oscillospiraceae bacterium]